MKYGKECVCGRGGECQGVSAAFALLKDPRRGYVQLPQYTPNPRTYEEKEMNDMRAAYLRHLRRTEESLGDSSIQRFVALHHFHPVVVQKHSEMPGALSPIPKTIKKVDMKYLKMTLGDEDRVRGEDGRKRKVFYFVPTHRMDQAKDDLKHMIRISRLYSEARSIAPVGSPALARASTGDSTHEISVNADAKPAPATSTVAEASTTAERAEIPVKTSPPPPLSPPAFVPAAAPAVVAVAAVPAAAPAVVAAAAVPAAAPAAVHDDVPDDILDNVPDNVPDAIPDDIPDAIPDAVPDIISAAPATPPTSPPRPKTSPVVPEENEQNEIEKSPPRRPEPETEPEPELQSLKHEPVPVASAPSSPILIPEMEEPVVTSSTPVEEILLTKKQNNGTRAESAPLPESLAAKIYEQEYEEEKLPSNMMMESEEGRKFLFRRMCTFERKREAKCSALVQQFACRWRSSLEVMQAGIFEVARAERLVGGTALANQAYAQAMQAMYDDVFLDAEGNVVIDPRKQKKLAKEREGLEYTIDTGEAASPVKPRKEAHTTSAMLGSLVDSHAVIAEKFTENSDRIVEEVVAELANLKAYLKQQMLDFKREGDPYIRDIQASETEVQTAYAVFEIVGPCPGSFAGRDASLHLKRSFMGGSVTTPVHASGSFHGTPRELSMNGSVNNDSSHDEPPKRGFSFRRSRHGSKHGGSKHGGSKHGSKHGSSHGDSTASGNEQEPEAMYIDPKVLGNATSPYVGALRQDALVRDGWLIEMMYRQAVNNQLHILQNAGAAIESIWQSMHNIELNRQVRLHETMLDFMPRQRRLFLGLSPIPGPILSDLVSLRMEPEDLEEQIEDTIRKRMQQLLKVGNAQRSSIMNRSKAQAPNLEDLQGVLTGEFFDNGLLHAAKIVERGTGLRGNIWKTSLAVVTSDAYLHMFDLTNFPEVSMGGVPEPVFELLLPDYDIPTLESDFIQKRLVSLLEHLTPVATLNLGRCTSTTLAEDPRVLDILEYGTESYFRAKKHSIRTTGREETEQLSTLLSSYRADATDVGDELE